MSREGLPISQNHVKELINQSAEKHEITLGGLENSIIDEILKTLPPNPNTAHLSTWCNNKVNDVLKKYPELESLAEKIRNDVGKELRYYLDQDKFKELKNQINDDIKNNKKINPAWIREKNKALSLAIRRGYKNLDGTIDYKFIFDKLEVGNNFSYQDREYNNPTREEVLDDLIVLLEEKNPITFNTEWITQNSEPIIKQLRKLFKNKETGDIEWNNFKEMLGKKWAKRWVMNYSSIKNTGKKEKILNEEQLQKNLLALEDLLENQQPNYFNPQFIRDNNIDLYISFLKNKTVKGAKGWSDIIIRLPQKWQVAWQYQESKNWTFKLIRKTLIDLVEKNKPKEINPTWIKDKDINLYFAIMRKEIKSRYPSPKNDWEKFISLFPDNIKNIWTYTEMRDWNFDDAIKETITLLEKKNPAQINPRWLSDNTKSLYHFFRSRFLVKKGLVDWEQIISNLPEKWQKKWEQKKVLEQLIPKETYSNQNEIKNLIEIHDKDLSKIFSVNSKEDKKTRDIVISDFIKLAQNGNKDAEEYLFDILSFGIDEMIENFEALKPWRNYPGELKEKIRRCIYLYDLNGKRASFFTYLFATLRLSLPQLENRYRISLNKMINTDQDIEGFIGKYDDEENVYFFGKRNNQF